MPAEKNGFFDRTHQYGEIATAVCFIVLCLAVSIQVISRYFFNHAFGWGEEFPIFMFLWVSFLAAAVAYRDGSHLSVDFVVEKLPTKIKKIINYVNLLLSLAFVFIIFYLESQMTFSLSESTFVVMKISKAYCYAGIPVACLLFSVFIIEKIIRPDTGKE